jgi:DNA-binding Lrp family transcriptional regulator
MMISISIFSHIYAENAHLNPRRRRVRLRLQGVTRNIIAQTALRRYLPQNLWRRKMSGSRLDEIDRKILAELQADGRMTNVELAKRVGISAPPCLRRVRTLEEAGYIRGYHADVNPRELGFEVGVFAMVRLLSQAETDLSAFEARCRAWPLVRECHMLNGEIDFILKCVAPDLSSFQRFLTEELTAAANVASVKTSLVIRCAKDQPGVPFEVLEARLSRHA